MVKTDALNNIENYYNHSPLSFLKAVPIDLVHFDKRGEYMCQFGCKNYGRKFSCPPESLGFKQELIKRDYKWAILFATTYKVLSNHNNYQMRALNRHKESEIQRICKQIGDILNTCGIDHQLLSGGSCHRCRECSYQRNEACKKPYLKQVSMEAVGIDCQVTMHRAGFDFQMPNNGSINRCGCILTNDESLSNIYLNNVESSQKYSHPSRESTTAMCIRLMSEYPELFEILQLVNLKDLKTKATICNYCENQGNNYACPPYSNPINIDLWDAAVLWKWRQNDKKKTRYNIALKTVHSAFFSLGHYFALSLRDCFCDECIPCNYQCIDKPLCNFRKLLAPSMQSQGINPEQFGEGKFGLELL